MLSSVGGSATSNDMGSSAIRSPGDHDKGEGDPQEVSQARPGPHISYYGRRKSLNIVITLMVYIVLKPLESTTVSGSLMPWHVLLPTADWQC